MKQSTLWFLIILGAMSSARACLIRTEWDSSLSPVTYIYSNATLYGRCNPGDKGTGPGWSIILAGSNAPVRFSLFPGILNNRGLYERDHDIDGSNVPGAIYFLYNPTDRRNGTYIECVIAVTRQGLEERQ